MSVDGWLQSIGHSSCSYVPGLISDQPVSPTAQSRLVLCQHPGPVSAPRPPPAQPGPPEPEWVWLSADTRASCPQWGPGVTSARVHCTRGLGVRWVTWHDASGGVKSKNPQVQSRQSEEKASLQWVQRNAMSASECIARECGVCNAALQRWEACRHCSVLLPLHSEWERARGLEMQFLPKPVLWCSVPSAGTTPCYNLSTESHRTVLIAAEPGLAGPGPGPDCCLSTGARHSS